MNPTNKEYRSVYPYFSTLSAYSENTLGFMKFNPPLAASLPNLRVPKDPPITYPLDYDSLSYPEQSGERLNLNVFYPSITNAYRRCGK
jgi:hypothetical protein